MRHLFLSFVAAALPVFFLADIVMAVSPGPNEALYEISPVSGTFYINGNFSIDLKINSSVGITSVKSYLNFTPAYFRVASIDMTNSVFGSQWEKTFDNTTGKIKIQASTPYPGFLGNGGLVASINFQAVAAGTAAITYDSTSLALTSEDLNVLNLSKSSGASFIIAASSGGDTTPPVRSNGQPTGTLTAGTAQTTISLTTNEPATCRYSTAAGTAYGSMANAFTTTGSTSHLNIITGLTNGGSYNYFVRCQDNASSPNQNTNDFAISFSVASPALPPVPPPEGGAGTLSVSLISNISSGPVPVRNVSLTARVSGTASGKTNYTFYCERADTGTNITSGWIAKYDAVDETNKTALNACNYQTAGTYTAKVIAERGGAAAQAQTTIAAGVTLPPAPPAVPASPGAKLIGDFNEDKKVDVYDLSMFLSNWKKSVAKYDLSSNGPVDVFDLSILLSNWAKKI